MGLALLAVTLGAPAVTGPSILVASGSLWTYLALRIATGLAQAIGDEKQVPYRSALRSVGGEELLDRQPATILVPFLVTAGWMLSVAGVVWLAFFDFVAAALVSGGLFSIFKLSGARRWREPRAPRVATQSEHPDESSSTADIEQLLEANIGDHILLTKEREELPKLLAPDERLLDVAPMALKGGRFGVLTITDRRLLHVHVGDVFSGSRITEIDYHNVRNVRPDTWRSFSRLVVDLKKHQRMLHFPSRRADFTPLRRPGSVERVEELATCIRNAVRRVQEPIKPTAMPLKPVG